MKKYCLLIIVLLFNLSLSNAQTLILQGKVLEANTGKPISTTIMFVSEDNQPLRTNSNSKDGTYQQAITYGKLYRILLKGYCPEKESEIIDLRNIGKYQEKYFDIKVTPIKKNSAILTAKIFEPNDSIIVDNSFLTFLKYFKQLNRKLNIKFKISSKDSWFKRKTIYIKKKNSKGRTYKKKVRLSTKTQLSSLLDARIKQLKELLKKNKLYFKDEAFIKDLVVLSPKKKRKKRLKKGSKRRYEYYIPKIDNLKIIVY